MQTHLYKSLETNESNARTSNIPEGSNSEIREKNESFVHRILKRFGGKTIYVHDHRYLTRYYLLGDGSGKGFEIYVHHMHDVDSFRWLHNHPWQWFLSFVVSKSYIQDVFDQSTNLRKQQHIRWFNLFRGLHRYHAIRKLPNNEAWTVVLTPPKLQNYEWGYWDEEHQLHIEDVSIGHESARTEIFGSKLLKD